MADLKDAIEGIKKTIEDAVASGDLIPRADAQAAVALMVEEAARLIISFPGGTVMHSPPQLLTEAHDAVMGLVPASALAELQALRDERDAAVANQFITRVERDGAEDHATETADELRQVRATPEALAASPEVAALIAEARREAEEMADGLVKASAWVSVAAEVLAGYNRDLGVDLPDTTEIGRIYESRDTPSFRITVGHIRILAAAIRALKETTHD